MSEPETQKVDADEHLATLFPAAADEAIRPDQPELQEVESSIDPPAVEEEPEVQATDGGEGEVSKETEPETPEQVADRLAEAERQAAGLKHELVAQRRKNRERAEREERMLANQEEMQKTLAELTAPPDNTAEMLEHAPEIKLVVDRVNELKNELTEMKQGQMTEAQGRAAQQELERFAAQSVQSYKQDVGDWDDAYQHVRKAYEDGYRSQGFEGPDLMDKLNADEQQLVIACREEGVNPAHAIYELAKQNGYQRSAQVSATETGAEAPQTQQQPSTQQQRVRRIKHGVEQVSPTQMAGTGGISDSRLSIEQVHALSPAKKMAIFADTDKLEELNNTGFVTM